MAEALGKDLYAVRLDTPSSRRGDLYRIVEEVRWELNLRGFDHVKIVASGGVDEYEILHLNPVVDAYGVGTSIANAPVLNFALDIMEIEGKPMAKRGKWSGAKDVLRRRGTLETVVVPAGAAAPAGGPWDPLLKPLVTRRPHRARSAAAPHDPRLRPRSARAVCRSRRCGGEGCAAISSGELMSSILERIVADKRAEVADRKRAAPGPSWSGAARPCRRRATSKPRCARPGRWR